MIVLDTNILIEILKNNAETLSKPKSLEAPFLVSVISAMELLYGSRNKQELKQLQNFLEMFKVIQINKNISKQAFKLVEEYSKSHTLDIPDALIAATCIEQKTPLFTYNLKDFRFIPSLALI